MMILALQAASSTRSVADTVNDLTTFLINYLTPLIAIGALSMALIELWKKLFDTRTKFQASRWLDWMQNSCDDGGKNVGANRQLLGGALTELLQLCSGASESEARDKANRLIEAQGNLGWSYGWHRTPVYAVFALELERMMGSIQEAADTTMATPSRYQNLYTFLTKGASADDVEIWQTGPDALAEAAAAQDNAEIKRLSETSARLRQIVKGKLDGFQLYTSDSWANRNQLAANLTGIVLMFVSLEYNRWVSGNHRWFEFFNFATWSMIPISLVGGILAPVAKDLVTALQKVKNG